MASLASPVPRDVETELRRVVDRWHQLPLDRASSQVGPVRALAQRLADEVAHPSGVAGDSRRIARETPATSHTGQVGGTGTPRLPDLGPAVLMDQLRVTVYDACAAGLAGGLAQDLARLRRELA